jgi:hypothetical protein
MLLLCGCLGSRNAISTHAVPTARTSANTNGAVQLPSTFRGVNAMLVRWDEEESKRWEIGCHRLSIYDSNWVEIASEVFRCHYGMTVDAVDLDGDSVPEFVVSLHLGPATGTSIKELKVLRLNGGFFEELLQLPLAGQAGPSHGWWYELSYEKNSSSAPAVLSLVLHHEPLEEWATFLPKTRNYRILMRRGEVEVLAQSGNAPN